MLGHAVLELGDFSVIDLFGDVLVNQRITSRRLVTGLVVAAQTGQDASCDVIDGGAVRDRDDGQLDAKAALGGHAQFETHQ